MILFKCNHYINAENNEDYLYNTTTDKLLMYLDLHFYTDVMYDEFLKTYKHRGVSLDMIPYNIPDRLGKDWSFSSVLELSMVKTKFMSILTSYVSSLSDAEYSSEIGESILAYTENLKYLFSDKSVKKIGKGAFYCCDNLEGVYIADSVTIVILLKK